MTKITASRENGRQRPKGYADWRPQAKTQALLRDVGGVLDEYVDHLPLTVRQIFYRLVGSYGYEKTELAYDRLAEALVRARRARLVDFDCIRDDGVITTPFEHYADVRGFWDDTGRRIKSYRRYRQAGQSVAIELWCEAAGMVPQLGRIAENYSIPVFSSGGFSSLSAVRMIVERARRQNVPTVLLHVGDYDPSGESIFAAMAEDAAAFLKEDRLLALQHLRAVRIALTDEQIDEFDLPTAPAKATDARSRTWKGETCQLEALAPDQLGTIVRNAIENELDLDRYRAELLLEHDDVLELWRGLPAGTSS